jgi:hypothetical protein
MVLSCQLYLVLSAYGTNAIVSIICLVLTGGYLIYYAHSQYDAQLVTVPFLYLVFVYA